MILELHSTRRGSRAVATLEVDRDYVIGSDASSDVVIEQAQLRPRHARLLADPQGACIEPLEGAPVTVNGNRVQQRSLLQDGDWLSLGGTPFQIRLSGVATAAPAPARKAEAVAGERLVFGRLPQCDVHIDSPLVSREHARLLFADGGCTLQDLGSTNGTFVNGSRITAPLTLATGDRIEIATFAFLFTGDGIQPLGAEEHGRVRVQVEGLGKQVTDRVTKQPKYLLNAIDFVIEPGEFVAIFGTSGSGKSTLLDALSGRRRASDGRVSYNGDDLYNAFDRFRSAIGYVPQQDIVHRKISVGGALGYTARLRLPPDTAGSEIVEHVERVLEQVGLADKATMAVDTPEPLSGGQLKRVSLGVELVANPNILFLDEVTSGLDAGTDKKMMQLFAELARRYDKTVVCVTHTLENIDACNLIVLLHRGRLVYYGPPAEARSYFDIERLSDVYELLEERPAEEWAARFRDSASYRRYVGERLQEPAPRQQTETAARGATTRRWFDLRQARTLLARYLALMWADTRNLMILFAQAPLIGLVIGLVFDTDAEEPTRLASSYLNMSFILMLSAIWFGCLNSAREVVKELPIYLRERSINLGIGPYLFSKLLPLSALVIIQCLLLLAVVSTLTDLPGSFSERLGALVLAGLASTAMGLTISTLVNSNDKAIAMVPLLLIPQVILSGAVVQLGSTSELIAKFTMVSYWAFDAMKASFDAATLALKDPTGKLLIEVSGDYLSDLGALSILGCAFLVTAVIGLKLKDRRG